MSRVFDALRKSEQERGLEGGIGAKIAAAGDPKVPSDSTWLRAIEGATILPCAASNGDRPAAMWHRAGQETFRVLHHRLQLLRQERPLKSILVTSAVPKEGKTTVAVNLAIVLARAAKRVLLIDADLRHPGVHQALGVGEMPGLAEWVEHRGSLHEALRRVEPYGLYYLAAGSARQNPGESLRQPALQEFLTTSAGTFDWVVVDSPPLVPFVDAHHLATIMDGILMVFRQRVTPRSKVQQALAAVDPARVVGAVLNGSREEQHDYYRYYQDGKAKFPENGQGTAVGRARTPPAEA
jgi:capsular exopolysaccharide synthesis family protein